MPVLAPRFQGTTKARLVDAGTGSAEDFEAIDVSGKAALITAADLRKLDDQARRAAAAGAACVVFAPTTPGPLCSGTVAEDITIPVVVTSHDSGQGLLSLLRAGAVTIGLKGVLESGYTYSTQHFEDGRIPDSWQSQWTSRTSSR